MRAIECPEFAPDYMREVRGAVKALSLYSGGVDGLTGMRALSLFSGAGGLDLAAEAAGIEIVGQCEIDKDCIAVLERHWPNVRRWQDVRGLTGDDVRGECGGIDIVFGGFPCQPHSLAGRRRASGDERDMWPEVARILRQVKPRWFVGENVPGLLSSDAGRFFGGILRDLAQMGYDAGWGVWGACDVGAPHRRERVFIVAHNPSIGWDARRPESEGFGGETCASSGGAVAHRDDQRQPQSGRDIAQGRGWPCDGSQRDVGNAERSGQHGEPWRGTDEQPADGYPRDGRRPEPGLGRMLTGAADRLDGHRWPAGRGEEQYDWEPPRVITGGTRGRAARLRMLGNLVVPQQAQVLFEAIAEAERRMADDMGD